MTRFQKLLIDYRAERELTQEDMARILGITQGCYSMWENGKKLPRPLALEAVVARLEARG